MSTITQPRHEWLPRVALAATLAAVLAGCGGGGSEGGGGGYGGGQPTQEPEGTADPGATTVLVEDASGASLLTDADGRTLYVSEQEQGESLCTSAECTAVWIPLTVPEGETPTGPSELTGTLDTLPVQDGLEQVTLDDRPLYTFAFDTSGGETSGEGVTDTFDGVTFTWHAATADGSQVEPGTTDDGGSGY
ncbi:COG4315 family predicted lipoprotein [Occultella gossypii]|uniref:Lipoprotein with Yx(FWY)xxD motif n=1 Tax=Occultella gossypii TaxID=2800820 RepID=A0ABS7S3Q0_9MICO|nr:hypothetical protein [Occultella gossypii]MBZ2194970.1 hypothetical protein [Occultella gossypii]